MKQLLALCRRAGIDQRSGIGIAGGDHAVERCVNLFERLQLLESPDVCGCRIDGRPFGGEVASGLIGQLLRHDARLEQGLITLGGQPG